VEPDQSIYVRLFVHAIVEPEQSIFVRLYVRALLPFLFMAVCTVVSLKYAIIYIKEINVIFMCQQECFHAVIPFICDR
jgi:hypothetical protein